MNGGMALKVFGSEGITDQSDRIKMARAQVLASVGQKTSFC